MTVHASVRGWFAAASRYLHREDLRCRKHRVAHTGKLARAVVLDLALLDVTGNTTYYTLAVERARYVAGRLAPDPEHHGLNYLPGRFDARNCSTSLIDSGECTDALARLLGHPQSGVLSSRDRSVFESTVRRNAETYLCRTVTEKGITNQRLWGAMGLASAYRLWPEPAWLDAIREAVRRSLAEQRADGSWGYVPAAAAGGAVPASADLTVYYHGRCLAFLHHILDCAPALGDSGELQSGLLRGTDFLSAVITPDGLKPLALETKRWFWDGRYEAGSNAYDVYALVRGAGRFGRVDWLAIAEACWRQLARHQAPDGGLIACLDPGTADFVCPDFHTADLAWPAQVMARLPGLPGANATSPASVTAGSSSTSSPRCHAERSEASGPLTFDSWADSLILRSAQDDKGPEPRVADARACERTKNESRAGIRQFVDAGLARLEHESYVAVLRTAKSGRDSLYGGAIGGGALVYAGAAPGGENRLNVDREAARVEGNFTLYPTLASWSAPSLRSGDLREGIAQLRQWLFVARLLCAEGRWRAAARRLWRGYLKDLVRTVAGPAGSHWATRATCEPAGDEHENGVQVMVTCRPARPDGTVPDWAADVVIRRTYRVERDGLHVDDAVRSDGRWRKRRVGRAEYLVPRAARELRVGGSSAVSERVRPGETVVVQPSAPGLWLRVAYVL